MNDPSLSVIVPNYNNERYLVTCVESILNQTYPITEVIVVDDCSTDGSREIICQLERRYPNVRAVLLPQNGGVSNARNIGLDHAIGEYVTYIDGDDFYYSKEKIEKEIDLIRKYQAKGEDILVYSCTVIVDADGNNPKLPTMKKSNYIRGNVKFQLLARVHNNTIPRDYIIKKDILQQVGAYSFYKNFYEDLDLLIRLSEAVPFYCTLHYGTGYRDTSSGLSKRAPQEHTNTINEIIGGYYRNLSTGEKVVALMVKALWKIEKKVTRYSVRKWSD